MYRPRSLLLVTALTCAVLPAAAHADVMSFDGTTVTIQGSDANEHILLSTPHAGFVQSDAQEAGPGCVRNEALEYVECPLGPGGVQVNMGGGNDRVTDLPLSEGALGDGVLRVDLGPGDDEFTGGPGGERVVGGPGNDKLTGAEGDDVLDGGDGNDDLRGDAGRDQLLAGAGDDVLDGDYFAAAAADLIDGGPGNDRANGWADPSTDAPHPPISITLDDTANDGRPGEGDDVRAIERLTSNVSGTIVLSDAPDVVEMWANIDGGASTIRTLGGNDTVTGGSRDETIDGGAGDDRLEGGFGNDTITGGPGRDTINADMAGSQCGVLQSCTLPFGNDVIDVRDGEADNVVCGIGDDKVVADPADTVAPDCEVVDRAGAGAATTPGRDPANGRPAGSDHAPGLSVSVAAVSRAAALRRGIPVTVAVPGAGRLSATAAERRRTIAKGSATATRAGKVTVRVEVTRAGRRALRSRRSHRITVRVTFTAAGAKPTSATRAVTLR